MTKPHIVGYQAAGEVVAVGAEVKEFKLGDKAVTTGFNGSHAELRAVAARTAWKIPDRLRREARGRRARAVRNRA